MEIFYSDDIENGLIRLDENESGHCTRVLRHRSGDEITVVDGAGSMYLCRLTDDSPKKAEAAVLSKTSGWSSHPYSLNMAVCPTKNADRFEWFAEKATEIGVDFITPIIGERSERRIFKPERCRKIVLSAMKQSLKALLPQVLEPVSVREFLQKGQGGLKLICYCFEGDTQRKSINDAIEEYLSAHEGRPEITVMIGPEGDFSPEEARLAIDCGYIPVHLGPSRLRTETAAVTAAAAVYMKLFM